MKVPELSGVIAHSASPCEVVQTAQRVKGQLGRLYALQQTAEIIKMFICS